MKIRYYGLNAFIIEKGKAKIAIDPGTGLFLIKPYSLIPKSEWEGVTHIFVTHGDFDHFGYAISMAKKTGAKVFCGEELSEEFYKKGVENLYVIGVDDFVDLGEVKVRGVKTKHGPFKISLGWGVFEMKAYLTEGDHPKREIFLFSKRIYKKEEAGEVKNHGTIRFLFGLLRMEKDNINFAKGSIGFEIKVGERSVINLGDTLLQEEWKGMSPDLLMIPIGGILLRNTMNESKSVEAVRLMQPKKVIPCHYDYFMWGKNMIPADSKGFKKGVEDLGVECILMKSKEEREIN